MSSNGAIEKDGLLSSSFSDKSIYPAPAQGRESAHAAIVRDKGLGQSTELRDEQESSHPASSHDGEESCSAGVQEKESNTSDGLGDTTSPEATEMVEQLRKRPIVGLHVDTWWFLSHSHSHPRIQADAGGYQCVSGRKNKGWPPTWWSMSTMSFLVLMMFTGSLESSELEFLSYLL